MPHGGQQHVQCDCIVTVLEGHPGSMPWLFRPGKPLQGDVVGSPRDWWEGGNCRNLGQDK